MNEHFGRLSLSEVYHMRAARERAGSGETHKPLDHFEGDAEMARGTIVAALKEILWVL